MLGIIIAMTQAGTMLVLDVGGGGQACGRGAGDDLVVCAPGDIRPAVMPVTIDGTPARLLVEAGGDDEVVCNPDFVARAGLAGRGPVSIADIGPVDVRGMVAEIALALPGKRVRQSAQWTGGRSVATADCVTGPRRLGYPSVRFLLGPARSDATSVTLPFARGNRGHIYGEVRVGREKLAVRFEPRFALTVLTASAARAIAPVHGGTTAGAVRMEPIAYGIARPVRRFDLHRPFHIGGLTLSRPYVRVADYGDANAIRSVDPTEAMPDDVVIAAKRGKPGGQRLVRVGGDDLARCVSITVDVKKREIVLVC